MIRNTHFACTSLVALLGIVGAWGAIFPANAQICLYLDFDEDQNPWTLRTETENTSETIKFVLEVPATPPTDRHFIMMMGEGCCNDLENIGWYGMRADWETLEFNPAYVDSFGYELPTCLDCCAWIIQGHFAADAAISPGERVFFGQVEAEANCNPVPSPPCDPSHDLTVGFELEDGQECENSEAVVSFRCPASATSVESWSRIKTLFQ
ncbi:MAG: hypothetical protein KAY32_11365 [Candidatus Eisenbacteria sp.]|nr:hypothetical protein [Candidatus Eisenbacteria bacterium]